MKILITGGFGYVGGRLGEYLASAMYEVYLGSRSSRAEPDWLSKGNVVQMDWTDDHSLITACKNMDVVIHTAGMNAAECADNPSMALDVNGAATARLVVAARKSKVSKFIYMSSAHVYSDNLIGLITEHSEVTNLHPYATSHVAGEHAVMNGHSKAGMQTVNVRLANAFGAPSHLGVNCWMLVVNDLCRQAAISRRLVIRGPSKAVRNFITMSDVCSGIECLISTPQVFIFPLICNLGDKTKSIFDIASEIKKFYADGKGITLPIVELSKDSLVTSNLSFRSMALESLGFQPASNFKAELNKLVEFCESNFRRKNDK